VLRELARAIRETMARLELKGARVLDYGCGDRPYEPWFTAAGAVYEGADLDGAHEVRIAPSGRLPSADASADVIVSFQVLEHVRDIAIYLGEARRVSSQAGRCCSRPTVRGSTSAPARLSTMDHRRSEARRRDSRLSARLDAAGRRPACMDDVLRALGFCHVLAKVPLAGPGLVALSACVLGAKAWIEDQITPREFIRDNACMYVALFERAP
jgi:SAM-dependent methyltransferase